MATQNQSFQSAPKGRGGARPGSGRKKQSLTVKTRQEAEALIETGDSPLAVMVNTMRYLQALAAKPVRKGAKADEREAHERACMQHRMSAAEVAQKCAPYMHAKLASVEVSGPNGGPVPVAAVVATATPDQAGQMYLDMVKGGE